MKFMPILDIAVAVSSFDDVADMEYKLKAHHIYHVYHKDDNEQLFFECRDMDAGVCTAHIYVVLENGDRWNHFLQFKDYLSINTDRLKKYNTLKQELAERYATDRRAYHQGKTRFMQNIMVEATDYFTLEVTRLQWYWTKNNAAPRYLRGYNKEHFEKTNKKQIVYVFDAENPGKEFHSMVTAMIE